MTIQMLTPYSLGRYTIPAGAVVGLFDAATEAGLIAAKQAIASAAAANWTVPVDNPQPASLTGAQVAATQALVSADGNLVVDSTAAAAANVAAFNAILARRGKIEVQGLKGTVFINDSLVIGSNTSLKLPLDLEIRTTGGAAHPLLVTEGYQRALGTFIACTLTWVAGRSVSVAKTAHGLTVGQYVFMYSVDLAPSNFIGVFPVKTVPDVNTFTIQLHRTPSASPTGTAQYVLADQNIEVEGGIWNGDQPNHTGTGNDYMGVILGNVAHVQANNMVGKNFVKYFLQFGATYDSVWDRISLQTGVSDTVKVYGPSVTVRGAGTGGWSGDDVVSIQGKEAEPFSQYRWCWGDVHDVEVDCTSGQTSNGGTVTVYGSPNEYVGDITIRNAGGSGNQWGVALTAGFNNSVLGAITIDGVRSGGASTLKMNANGYTGLVINSVVVRGFRFEPDTYASNRQGIVHDASVTVRSFTLYDPIVDSTVWPSAATIMCQHNGVVGTWNLIGGRFSGNGSNGRLAAFPGGVTTVNLGKATFGTGWSVGIDLSVPGATVNISQCDLSMFGAAVQTTAACSVNLNGNRCNTNSNGVVRANAAVAITVKSAANTWVTNNSITNGSGNGDWRVYGWDMPINLNTTGINKTVAGQFCFNTTLAGTLAANRLAHCNGTNFLQLDTPANVF